MISTATLLLLLTFSTAAQGVDIGNTGKRIILQNDVETLIITLQLSDIKNALVNMVKHTQKLKDTVTTPQMDLRQQQGTNLGDYTQT